MSYESIPQELRSFKQWVCSSLTNKMPVQICGKAASCTDASTWNTFDACVAATKSRHWGIGFVFTNSNQFTVIDLDHVRDAATGETEPWALAVIDECRSYTELSMSGTGWHIVARGTLLAGAGNKAGRVEMYDHAKVMTLTGNLVPFTGDDEIRDVDVARLQARLRQLDPVQPIKAAQPVTVGTSMKRSGVDESVEDFKLLAQIMRRLNTKDTSKIEQEFARRFPERYRRKAPRCGKTYIGYSIDRLLTRGN